MSEIKGYKVFNLDWTCRGFQYEVGKTFEHNGNIEMCGKGFHFCRKASDCFEYYKFDSKNKVAEVRALGLVETQGNKSVTDKIEIVREIGWHELLEIVNTGQDCTGLCNSGNRNSGNWNSGDFCSGFFNSKETPLYVFNKKSSVTRNEFANCQGVQILNWHYKNSWWVYSQNMTDEEKSAHPEHETTGGYLKVVDFKEACALMWENLDGNEKKAVAEIPHFNAKVFKEITGIDVKGE